MRPARASVEEKLQAVLATLSEPALGRVANLWLGRAARIHVARLLQDEGHSKDAARFKALPDFDSARALTAAQKLIEKFQPAAPGPGRRGAGKSSKAVQVLDATIGGLPAKLDVGRVTKVGQALARLAELAGFDAEKERVQQIADARLIRSSTFDVREYAQKG